MDFVSISLALATLAAIATAVVGVFVWFSQKHNELRLSFLVLSIFIGLWILSNVVFGVVGSNYGYPVALSSYLFAMGVAVSLLLFSTHLSNGKNIGYARLTLIGFPGLIVGALSAVPGLVATGVVDGKIITNTIPLTVFGVTLVGYLVMSSVVLGIAKGRVKYVVRQQISAVLAGMAISSVAGGLFNLILPIVGEYRFVQLGPASAAIFIGVVAYVIVKHRLFDVRLAVVRSIVYFMILVTFTATYFGLAYIATSVLATSFLSVGQLVINITTVFVMVLLFQPMKRFFDKVTNRFFYKDNYNIDEFYTRFNKVLTSTTDLRVLLERISTELATTLKSDQVFLFVHALNNHFVISGTPHHKHIPVADALMLDEAKSTSHGVLVASLIEGDAKLYRMMQSHRIELALRLGQDNKSIGYLCLGSHLNSGYTTRDLGLLSAISDELVIAIQNALSVQEVRNLNETLQQRIDEATRELRASNAQLQRLDKAKDEFVSMASHQLRTPLTSVKGYISMVLEGDAGKISDKQEHLLSEAFISSERMVRLISDFLNVSRLQTGKFIIDKRPLNLAKVVEQELDSLSTNASSRGLKFSYKPPANFPILNIDEDKIRQVIMNFSDNAIYYSGESTEIKVNLSVDGDNCKFTVKDTGIGVPHSEQAQLFSKFYRASNARKQRPDGTGVGLFLAKKVINAHGGDVIFESTEGKGSTFGFSLPIVPLRTVNDANQLKNQPDDN